MREKLNRKIKSAIKNIPELIEIFSKQIDPFESWDSYPLSHKRKKKF